MLRLETTVFGGCIAGGVFLAMAGASWGAPRPEPGCLESIVTPAAAPCVSKAKMAIQGDTLYLDGLVNGMIYDALMDPRTSEVQGIRRVELNSYGGLVGDVALLAGLIRSRGWATHLREGATCASTCILLLQAGLVRTAHPSARIGVHGVRLGEGYQRDFMEACSEGSGSQEACDASRDLWYRDCLAATREFFEVMRRHGASPALLEDYLRQPEEERYYWRHNGLRIQDWVLDPATARTYGILSA